MVAKFRKNKGWTEASWTVNKYVAIEENLPTIIYWDNWNDPRDGMRGQKDRTLIQYEHVCGMDPAVIKRNNKHNKKKELVRKLRKKSPRNGVL